MVVSEFLTLASRWSSEEEAASGIVEWAAQALDADGAALIVDGNVIAAVGQTTAGERKSQVVPLDYPASAALVIARASDFTESDMRRLRVIAHIGCTSMRLHHLVEQEREHAATQSALRRVATLVAQGVDEQTVFNAIAQEVARLVSADFVQILNYESNGTALRLATTGKPALPIGERRQLGGNNVLTKVLSTRAPARINNADELTGVQADLARSLGVRSVIGAPIFVEGTVWGVVIASSTAEVPMPAEAERRLIDFTELAATAISNAQARTELAASRARMVMESDATRRRLERDLHDGVQQRLVTLALDLRDVIDASPSDQQVRLMRIERDVQDSLEEIRELSRGLHPAILSEAGLRPALRSLARRSPLPVELDVSCEERLPGSIEAAAYYLVSEALANAAKHAQATAVRVGVQRLDGTLRIEVSDDGVGGADSQRGSGLIGLRDRFDALGGTVNVSSLAGAGTTIVAELPA